jgi:hypothetical protein
MTILQLEALRQGIWGTNSLYGRVLTCKCSDMSVKDIHAVTGAFLMRMASSICGS